MFYSVRSRVLLLVVLLGALTGVCVWYGSLGPDPAAWALAGEEELAADYDRYVDERVAVGGIVESTEPVAIAIEGGELRLTVDGVPADRVDVGDSLRVYGVAESDRTLRALNAVVVPAWRHSYMVAVSFLAGLWVLGRILTQWRVGARGLVPRYWPISVGARLRSLAGREGD